MGLLARVTSVVLLLPGLVLSAAEPGPPGVVVAHSPASSRQYIGSPGLAVLPSGEYLAAHDWFGPGSTADRTRVFASADRGQTWSPRAEITGQWWSSLFVHRGAVYLLGTSRENGFCVIRRSADGGHTWTEPRDAASGLLWRDGRYHCAPVPVVVHEGRLWRAMEDAMGPGGWGEHFHSFMMSVSADADLLNAANWTFSNRILGNPRWLDGQFRGWLEGNAVVTPQGRIVTVLRVDSPLDDERAAIVEISADGRRASFDPATGFISFPGGAKKFSIRADPRGGGYWALTNDVPPARRRGLPSKTRNTLALTHSRDLYDWQVRAVLLEHPDPERHGFQYVDWLYDGDDLIALVRTAFDDGQGGAHNQHDANYLTFHRFAKFRELGTP
jgi:hypothetical protein